MNQQTLERVEAGNQIDISLENAQKPLVPRGPDGRLLPGARVPGAGRKVGSRTKIVESFTDELYKDFQANGPQTIVAARERDPMGYVKMIAGLLPKEMTITRPLEGLSDDELHEAIAQIQAAMLGMTIDGSASKVIDQE